MLEKREKCKRKSSCEGVYADVVKTDVKLEKNSHYIRMISKYREHKEQYVKSIGFNASNYDNMFGKITFW